ncbi:MAG: poly(3-hydroxybutyrate) depolymerase [Gammaproteobacteria bacterium]|nr:poly(3-hydroxybutyrate) depolymerase [Gammaproteobacteria bacterium]
MSRRLAAVAALLLLAGCSRPSQDDGRLAALPIDPASVTVSGLSAGANMAVQFHVAYSALVQGAGLVAGAPYYCAANSMADALGRCMKGDEEIPVGDLVGLTSQLALDDAVDPIAELAQDRVWIFHGANDPYVAPPVADALEAYYQALVNPANVARVEHPRAGHNFPSANTAAKACEGSEPPFVGNCGFDGAAALLGHLYGKLRPGRAPERGELTEFDQGPYARASGSAALSKRGWIFVPKTCRGGGKPHCRLHVVFHGCKQGASLVGREFILESGFLEAAAGNDTVLLFPQIEASYQPLNPMGCWDWWGYEGESYAVKAGPQMAAVRLMIGDLLGEPRG